MTSTTITVLTPLKVALPDPPSDSYFTLAQWTTLLSLIDTVIPAIKRQSAPSPTTDPNISILPDSKYNAIASDLKKTNVSNHTNTQLDEYLSEKPSDNPEFEDLLRRTLVQYSREDARNGLAFLTSTLNTRLGSLLLTGGYTPFHEQSSEIRTQILQGWSTSRLLILRVAFKQITFVAKNLWLKTSPTFYTLSGFPKVPEHYKPGPSFSYTFEEFGCGESKARRGGKDEERAEELFETDVVIVGSGCGGAVCAKNLAEAGHKVLVVEKGYHFSPSQLPMSEKDGGIHLYVDGGVVTSDDASITVIAGSNWGGGGTINWSASLQPQSFVREEWSRDRKLPLFTSSAFQDSLDRVCNRMGVSTTHIRHNHGNEVLMEGARRLGMTYKPVPQNTGGKEHFCGHCTLGCGAAEKQGPVVSWLPDAQRAGARFAEGLEVEQVLFETVGNVKKAVGIKGVWKSRNKNGGVDGPDSEKRVVNVIVRAKKVIVSCGTLWSPIVLKKSGLTNKHIGRNLYLHPVNIVSAHWPEDIRPWEGGILTSVVTSLENLDGHGHGTKLETTCMMPSWCLTFNNWTSGLEFKLRALTYRHMNSFISITRDRDTGRVYPDPKSGMPRIAYTPSAFDRAHTLEGVLALARIAFTMGASEISVAIANIPSFSRRLPLSPEETEKQESQRFETWLSTIKSTGNAPPGGIFASAHQMGTNRMSAHPSQGVVDPTGKVWGTEGLYVSDASVFPSASGVNPMITNMAISDWISRNLDETMRREEKVIGLARL